MTNNAPITLAQLFRYVRKNSDGSYALPHQAAGIAELELDIQQNGYAAAMRRDRPWFAAWSQGGKQPDPVSAAPWLPPARAIVQKFEGCRLTAYPDPETGGEPWTIGWGTTTINGKPVTPRQTCTQDQADAWLDATLRGFHADVLRLLPMASNWSSQRQAALLSFAYNVGAGALADSTLRRRLLAGEDPAAVVREELPKWINAGGPTEAGLRRRRAAEIELFTGEGRPAPVPPAAAPAQILKVPYYSQRDSDTAQAMRMCFSSSCAMLLETLRPGTLRGANGDDTYLGRVLRYGDTIHPAAQIKALAHYGVQARFDQACTPDVVKAQIDRGIPVPLGCIHKGGLNNLHGDGHWIIAIGYDDNSLIVNDPYGEMDIVNGGYLNSNGRRLRYSFKNFCRRWEVVRSGNNYRYAPGNGWAVVAEP
jgi:GH24 family phage-related lysozyme (muramidase)/uncharacterized protein YvpB